MWPSIVCVSVCVWEGRLSKQPLVEEKQQVNLWLGRRLRREKSPELFIRQGLWCCSGIKSSSCSLLTALALAKDFQRFANNQTRKDALRGTGCCDYTALLDTVPLFPLST